MTLLTTMMAETLLAKIVAADRRSIAHCVNALESRLPEQATLIQDLISELILRESNRPVGIRVGITGPPGAGKSSLLMRLALHCRQQDKRFATVAVDPSSPRSGGSLLGDRARMQLNPEDDGVFFRSMATGQHQGGLSYGAAEAVELLSHAFDVVCLETTGVGQNETEVCDAVDIVVMVIQPGSGDSLQFIKAGVMEIPDLLVVNKSDLPSAQQSASDLATAFSVLNQTGTSDQSGAAILTSALHDDGIDELYSAIVATHASIDLASRREAGRRARALSAFRARHGSHGLQCLGGSKAVAHLVTQLAGSALSRAEVLSERYMKKSVTP